MVSINLDHEKYQFTTKNALEHFNIDEEIINTKGMDLKFYFKYGEPYLMVVDKEYAKEYEFESRGSMVFFLQKLALNSTLMTSLSNETLTAVVNERLQQFTSTLNLVVDKHMNHILTVTTMSGKLVSWRKILEIVHAVFEPLPEKTLYLTTFAGLGISIKMNDDEADLDVIRIEPQTPSSISIYRGFAKDTVSLKGYDEAEIMEYLSQTLNDFSHGDASNFYKSSVVQD
jgi:hypothetical protein